MGLTLAEGWKKEKEPATRTNIINSRHFLLLLLVYSLREGVSLKNMT